MLTLMSEFLTSAWHSALAMGPWLLVGAAIAGVLHVWIPQDVLRRHFTGPWGVVKAVLFGVPLPLCSCGVIPAGIGLNKSGADDSASIAFLISTPQTGVDSILVSAGMLGWPFALWKVGAAVVTGVAGGMWVAVSGRRPVGDDAIAAADHVGPAAKGWRAGMEHGLEVLRTIYRWVAFGVVVSALLTAFVPAGVLASAGEGSMVTAVVASLLVSVPLYVCATASVPIAAALVMAGLPLGAALVFLMAGPATNVATIGAIHRVFGRAIVVRYLTTIIGGSILFALLFDGVVSSHDVAAAMTHPHGAHWLEVLGGGGLVALMAWFMLSDIRRWIAQRPAAAAQSSTHLMVEGMSCGGCVRKVRGALESVAGVETCDVDLDSASASVSGAARVDDLVAALQAAGFKARRSTSG